MISKQHCYLLPAPSLDENRSDMSTDKFRIQFRSENGPEHFPQSELCPNSWVHTLNRVTPYANRKSFGFFPPRFHHDNPRSVMDQTHNRSRERMSKIKIRCSSTERVCSITCSNVRWCLLGVFERKEQVLNYRPW
ncbi:hypothetical protein GWI33_014422 [Rhynchophorus ferrugineus]|uniref:Uncharacterized protein n=1 Tax=Rhynchophorus ferrugineus TaxID=354439 RepID=A0A834I526_RHYFE|nr:hypothetical protein GWI33_014422 [Rhynchophorus ferrugineus]